MDDREPGEPELADGIARVIEDSVKGPRGADPLDRLLDQPFESDVGKGQAAAGADDALVAYIQRRRVTNFAATTGAIIS